MQAAERWVFSEQSAGRGKEKTRVPAHTKKLSLLRRQPSDFFANSLQIMLAGIHPFDSEWFCR
jgi:hypothetical protein